MMDSACQNMKQFNMGSDKTNKYFILNPLGSDKTNKYFILNPLKDALMFDNVIILSPLKTGHFCQGCTLYKAAFPRAMFLCHILHALQS